MNPLDETARRRLLAAAFRMPQVQTMVSRKSSITNAFVNAIIPVVNPSIEEIAAALQVLGMDPADVRCAYCGDKSSEWDHLRPLVLDQRPTGFISEIANLVPSCGKCNQSKGNKPWREWMISETGQHSPTVRKIIDTQARLARLEDYETKFTPRNIDFEQELGVEDWANYWKMWVEVNEQLKRCQEVAEGLRKRIGERIK